MIRAALLTVPLVLLLVACRDGVGALGPLASGQVVSEDSHPLATARSLSPGQLEGLGGWLDRRPAGWQPMVTESTAEPRLMTLALQGNDGRSTILSVVTRRDGGHDLLLTTPGRWAYESSAGAVKTRAAIRSLPDEDLGALLWLVTPPTAPPR
jgi:hypothetical protein